MNAVSEIGNCIRAIVIEKINAGHVVAMQWITQEVLNEYPSVDGDDVDFYMVCARNYIAFIAKKEIQKYQPKAESDKQMTLEGFEHLQKAYPVDREGERYLVPVQLLTNEELAKRADEYRKMGDSCYAHALEIEKYITSRVECA